MAPIILTGDRPTGALHLGHYAGSLAQRVILQEQHPIFVLIADTQVLNNDVTKAQHVKAHTLALMRDYMAVGLKPEKVTFVLQSAVSELFELSSYFANIVSLAQIQRIPTIKKENSLYNQGQANMGFLNYPIAQSADIALFGATLVPVGEDQVPILEFGNDLLARFNHHFSTSYFERITPILSSTPRLMGLDGKQKMSKSLNNAIYLRDDEKTLKKKINLMYTDSNHLNISDPGCVEGNVVFDFLEAFYEDKKHLEELKKHYRQGGLGDGQTKSLLFNVLNPLLNKFRENCLSYTDSDLYDILHTGTQQAQKLAKQRMQEIRDIIFK